MSEKTSVPGIPQPSGPPRFDNDQHSGEKSKLPPWFYEKPHELARITLTTPAEAGFAWVWSDKDQRSMKLPYTDPRVRKFLGQEDRRE